jgi:predicted CXXCH cytochrome family protein
MKKVLVLLVAATFGLAGTALALHDGGVARCEACHTMHNSLGNVAHDDDINGGQFTTGPFLLKGNDQSSACLNCHGAGSTTSSYHVSTEGVTTGVGVPMQFTPGGDFSWIKATTGTTADLKGHNIIAADFGYSADARAGMVTSPGGNYPNASFGCQSCHDPHGKSRLLDGGTDYVTTGAPIATYGSYGALPTATTAVGAYRILGGTNYEPKSVVGLGLAFANNVPVATAPSGYNSATAPGGVRVAYGSNMAEWCANCHAGLHNEAYPTNLRHPSGNAAKLGATIAGNYNAYKKTGDLTGTSADSFLPLVPFETGQGAADRAALATLQATATGPDATANVMCLSCHRAHASGFESMLRWDHKATFVVDATGAYAKKGGIGSDAQMTAAYYNKPAADFGAYQRSLCNKCHAKD